MDNHGSSEGSAAANGHLVNHDLSLPCVICFVDLIGSSAVSNELSPSNYWQDYVSSFYLAIERAKEAAHDAKLKYVDEKENENVKWDYRGDELVGFVFLESEPDPVCVGEVIAHIVRFIYGLRLFWLGSLYNQERLKHHQVPRSVAAGIHYGRVVRVEASRNVGYAINLAKRVEGMSRLGASSGIFATGEVKHLYELWVKDSKQRRKSLGFLKGIRFGELRVGPADKFKGIDPVPYVCEIEPDRKQSGAPDLLQDLYKRRVPPKNLQIIGKYLTEKSYNDEKVRWWKERRELLVKEIDIVKLMERYVRQSSNLWFQIDACLLLAAIGKAEKTKSLFDFVIKNVKKPNRD